jgi:hypothetical protein
MNTQEPKFDYVEFYRGGGCKIIENGFDQNHALELVPEIERFNRENSSGLCYRMIMSVRG